MHAGNSEDRLPDEQASLVVEVFRMLADATRVQVLWSLTQREMSVNELAEHVGKPAPSVSQHLAKLRMAASCAPVGTEPPSSTAWRTTTSASSSLMLSSMPSTPVPGFPAITAATAG